MTQSSWVVPLAALTLTQIAAVSTSVYLHRGLAHRALRLHPVADMCFRALLWLTTGQNRREWVAVHRKHHKFTDRTGDPHSPKVLGFWRIQLFNVYYYVREAKNLDTIRTFAPDLPEDRWDRAIFSWGRTGLATGIALLCLVAGSLARSHRRIQPCRAVRLRPRSPDQRARPLARGTEFRKHRIQLAPPCLGDRWGEPAQQSSCASARPEVQHAEV